MLGKALRALDESQKAALRKALGRSTSGMRANEVVASLTGLADFFASDADLRTIREAIAAGAPEVPQPLVDQLHIDGHLVIPIGGEKQQHLTRVTRTEAGTVVEDHGACQFVKLIGKHGWES